MLSQIKACFNKDKVLYSRHARVEMEVEPLGIVTAQEVYEAAMNGKLIEDYPNDKPYPSCLVYGKTREKRPIHFVCAYAESEDLIILVTVYEPSPEKWTNFEKRKK